ncbi:pectate lyase family protein [Flavobacterium hibisci]|uniref:pectate lyase family protein n=1 Tax=Flavobacterium hibisci TaxID=1914462 RepID=UPI001CC0C00D|nr:T9SS type A sorting domain-containing protein [Flavobacterium hibisci]MBZ4040776.1 T9SS type A sorting domain-containing protein [Flavobacterium hibisci]
MKKTLPLLFFLLGLSTMFGQNYYMSAPEGFGAAATGGGTPTVSNTVTVTTYEQLETALNSKTVANSVILVSGTINCQYTSVSLTNKTIIGLPGARLINTQLAENVDPDVKPTRWDLSGILYIKSGSNNVIIRNLVFEGPGAYDVDGRDLLTSEGNNIWVDHCEFQDGMDGNFDIKGKADNTTVSWCKFTYTKPAIQGGFGGSQNHSFTNLVGSGVADAPTTDGRFSVTFKNCYWADGCKERMPRARNAELHILNCYYKTSTASAKAIGLGAGNNGSTCYVENSNFEQIANISSPVTEGTGTAALFFDNCIKGSTSTAVTGLNYGTTPSKPSYVYTTLSTADVAKYVANTSCGAGATLQVTADGVISTGCPNTLGLNDNVANLEIKYYPTVIDNVLNIEFSSIESGKAIIEIYSPNGSKVYTTSKNISGNEKLELNIANITRGVYICKVQIENRVKTFKILKG